MVKIISFFINLLSKIHLNLASKLSYFFFSTPFKGKLDINELPTLLKEADLVFCETAKNRYAVYHWAGAGSKILLIHGWESNSSRWEQLIVELKKYAFDIYAIDAPAHGLTNGKRFNVFDYSLCIANFQEKYQIPFIVGHSIGGTSVMYYLTHYPIVVKKVVILGAPSEFENLISNFADNLKLNQKIYNQLIKFLNEKYKYPVLDFSIAKFCESLNIEGKIIHDQTDDVISINEGLIINKNWANSTFESTKDLGHSLQDQKVFDSIIAFFKKP
jgi:triacylglycerol esterase/lipase EstA (alpha/beta hydrolase family)